MIEIKEMTFSDFEEIKDNLQTDFDEFWTPGVLKSELESNLSKYVVAKENEKIVGFAGIIILPDDVEITNIVTKKTERKSYTIWPILTTSLNIYLFFWLNNSNDSKMVNNIVEAHKGFFYLQNTKNIV